MQFPFALRGRPGCVTVEYGRNDDPARWGYNLLELPWPIELAAGLPVLRATVTYEAEGYAAVMGWIQVVRIHVAEESRPLVEGVGKAPAGDHAWVDGPPQLRGLGVPFISFGVCPSLFDAPASTESDIRFAADSFLTASPDGLISRRSQVCFGMRWGYATTTESEPELLTLTELGAEDWAEACAILAGDYPDWMFET